MPHALISFQCRLFRIDKSTQMFGAVQNMNNDNYFCILYTKIGTGRYIRTSVSGYKWHLLWWAVQ